MARCAGRGTCEELLEQLDEPALQLVMYWSLYEGSFGPLREFTPAMAQFQPFTDDHAPVEQLIDGLIFSEVGRIDR